MAGVKTLSSAFLRRNVRLDWYVTGPSPALVLFNDGQDLDAMGIARALNGGLRPLLCVGIHAGSNRLQEYGTAASGDFAGRGSRAFLYTHFVVQELLPFLQREFSLPDDTERAFAGFSLGGLSALDIVWNHPWLFRTAGVFSGSLWWRSKGYDAGYNEDTDRIMHAQVRDGRRPGPGTPAYALHSAQRFFFECGTADEKADRNGNGVIDVIDDTLDLIGDLKKRGVPPASLRYLEIPGGEHNPETWGRALPEFLRWGWGRD